MLLVRHQLFNLSISDCKIVQSLSLLISRQSLVSSAYSDILVLGSNPSDISLINNRNNKGPKIEPCGTPEFTGLKAE